MLHLSADRHDVRLFLGDHFLIIFVHMVSAHPESFPPLLADLGPEITARDERRAVAGLVGRRVAVCSQRVKSVRDQSQLPGVSPPILGPGPGSGLGVSLVRVQNFDRIK